MTITPFFRWYDLWIGAYVDVPNRTLYVCPVPMLGLKIVLGPRVEGARPLVGFFYELRRRILQW